MLAKILIELEYDESINFNKGSILHGFMMEIINKTYAKFLHENNLKPFSQYIQIDRKNKTILWKVATLNKIAKEQILDILLNINEISLKKINKVLKIKNRNFEQITYDQLIKKNIEFNDNKYIKFNFVTPISFKRNNKYEYFPNLELIFKSLAKKWDYFNDEYKMNDEDVIYNIVKMINISRFKIQSCEFYLEQVKVPAYMGQMTLRCAGNKDISLLVHILKDFGTYSGVGVKTSMGMGGIE